MQSIRPSTNGLQIARTVGKTPRRSVIPSALRLPATHQYGNRATYITRATQKRAPSIHSTRVPLSLQHINAIKSHRNPSIQSQTSSSSSATVKQPTVHHIFENVTGTWQYIVADPSTSTAVIVDPVLDYDPATQTITTKSADALLSLVAEQGYKVDRILETHVHADHLTAASYLQSRLSNIQGVQPPIGIGKRIEQVQKLFAQRYGIAREEWDGVFDRLFDDDEVFSIGEVTAKAVHLPGHTPDHLGYQIGGPYLSLSRESMQLLTTRIQITSSAATPSSTQTSAQRDATFPAAMQAISSNQVADYSI